MRFKNHKIQNRAWFTYQLKKLITIYIIFFILSCRPNIAIYRKTDWEKEGLKGEVKQYTKYEYDIKKNLRSKISYLFNRKGRIIEKSSFNSNGNLINRIENKYNDIGDTVETVSYNPEGNLTNIRKYNKIYDKAGNMIKSSYHSDGRLINNLEKEYNSRGDAIKTKGYAYGSEYEFKYDYIYDSSGNKIKKTTYYFSRWLVEKEKYDTKGNLIEHSHYNTNGNLSYRDKYIYDSDSNMVEKSHYVSDNNLQYKTKYKYDSNGNRIQEDSYNTFSNVKWRYKYINKYNKIGNIIEKTKYHITDFEKNSKEVFKTMTVYEYIMWED